MKIVILKGSPHKQGSSNLLAQQFIKGAMEAGHAVSSLDAAHMELHPCVGCEHCGMNGPCVWQDDMPEIRDALLAADMVVFVTPVYYFGMPALVAHYQKLCRYMNFSDQGMVLGTGCGTPAMTARSSHISAAYELGKSL